MSGKNNFSSRAQFYCLRWRWWLPAARRPGRARCSRAKNIWTAAITRRRWRSSKPPPRCWRRTRRRGIITAWRCNAPASRTMRRTPTSARLSLDRDLVEAQFNLGILHLEQNQPDAAKTELTAYTLRRPNDPAGWLKLGSAQLKLGEIVPAERSFSAVLALKTNEAEAYNGLGLARIQRGQTARRGAIFRRRRAGAAGFCPGHPEPRHGEPGISARQPGRAGKLPRLSRAHAAPGQLGRGERHRQSTWSNRPAPWLPRWLKLHRQFSRPGPVLRQPPRRKPSRNRKLPRLLAARNLQSPRRAARRRRPVSTPGHPSLPAPVQFVRVAPETQVVNTANDCRRPKAASDRTRRSARGQNCERCDATRFSEAGEFRQWFTLRGQRHNAFAGRNR